jgi:dolichyl-phosphate-mannose-protein mannosyltransferase
VLIAPPPILQLVLSAIVPLLVFGAVGWLVGSGVVKVPQQAHRLLASRFAPLALAVVSAALVWFAWRSLDEPGVFHDEHAYLLQAQIFSTGRWTGEAPPLPAFFDQMHVLIGPTLAPKYPPGNALLMVPGIWVGLPGLATLLLNAVAGGLVFAIVRRLTDPAAGLLTWALWSSSTAGLFWRSSYFSQNVTTVLWLLSLLALLMWRAENRMRQLMIATVAVGWMYLARPFTALVLAIPIAIFILMHARRHRLFHQVAWCFAVAVPVAALYFIWQERTTGHWLDNPYVEYSRQYLPFDKPGFGLDSTPPERPLSPAVAWISDEFAPLHAEHVPRALPRILRDRVFALIVTIFQGWRAYLLLLFCLGAVVTRGPARFGLVSIFLIIGAHLIYAHFVWWTLYYVETLPVFFFLGVSGLIWIGRFLLQLDASRLQSALMLAAVLMTPWLAHDVFGARQERDRRAAFQRQARATLAAIPGREVVVFVHYPEGHLFHDSLVVNTPDYRTARLWLVYDRGPDNARLLELTDRPAFKLYTDTWTLERIR